MRWLLPAAWAWSKEGHEACGMTTMSALSPVSVTELKRIMKGKDVTDVSGWAHKVNTKYAWTSDLHFQLQPEPCAGGVSKNEQSCKGNYCLLGSLEYFYGLMTDTSTPEAAIKMQQGVSFTDSDGLKYLINLLGDMHQPMHLGLASNKAGKDVQVTWRGEKLSLFTFFDEKISQHVIATSPAFWWGGWTNIDRARTQYEQDAETWRAHGVKSFGIWANQTAQVTCQVQGQVPKDGKQLAITDRLFEQWKQIELTQVLRAGGRTAIVLNAILESRKGRVGSEASDKMKEFEDKEPEEEAPIVEVVHVKKEPNYTPIQAFGINFTIFVIILCFYVWLTNAKAGPTGSNLGRPEAANAWSSMQASMGSKHASKAI